MRERERRPDAYGHVPFACFMPIVQTNIPLSQAGLYTVPGSQQSTV